jgi:hypothetical protein
MFSRIWTLSLIAGLAALLTGADGEKTFHGVHEGKVAGTKLDYPELYAQAVPLSRSDEGRALLESCLEAYGGREHLARLNSVCIVHDMESAMYGSGRVERTLARGRLYRIERSGEIRTLSGDQTWYQAKGGQAQLGEQRYLSELFSYLTLRLPGVVEEESFAEPRYGRREGDELEYLFFDKPDSLMLVVGIDPETHFIRSSEGVIQNETGFVVYINRFADHQNVDGYVFPASLVNASMGLEVAQSTLVSVEVDCKPRSAMFQLDGVKLDREGR